MNLILRLSVKECSLAVLNLAYLIPILLLVSCGPDDGEQSATAVEDPTAKGIAWYEGNIDSAFALAKAEGKPLFLYWGCLLYTSPSPRDS